MEKGRDARTKLSHREATHMDGSGDENAQFELPSGSRANIDTDLQVPRRRKQRIPPDTNQCQGECCRAKVRSEGREGESGRPENSELKLRNAKGVEQEARRAERRSKRAERSLRRTRQIRDSSSDAVEGSSKDLLIPSEAEGRSSSKEGRSSSTEGRSQSHERNTRRMRESRPRRKHKHFLVENSAHDPQQHVTTSLDDCQTALRNAERQQDEMIRRTLEHRLQALEEATKKRREAKARKRAGNKPDRTRLIMEETENSLAPRELRQKRGIAPVLEAPAGISEQAARDRRKMAHAARIRERKQAQIALIERERQEAAREAERAEAELRLQVELQQQREREERALLSVRAAERERQMMLLLSPQSVYHARTHPPPRDEYSTVDEDIPPYRAQLHKYLDLVAYDERFAPVLRVNRYLIDGDCELTEAIDKFKQFNLLPKKTDLWSISHVDDNEYEQMIPVLIPEHSYGNELEGF